MLFKTVSLMGHWLSRSTRSKSITPPRPRRCKLVGEHLETRFALAALDISLSITDAPLNTSFPALVASVTMPTDLITINPPPVVPPPLGGLGGPNTAPVIHDFACVLNGGTYTITGWVSDDQDPTGYVVNLSGVVSAPLIVGVDDHFSYTFQCDPLMHGPVYATTLDIYGLLSNQAVLNI